VNRTDRLYAMVEELRAVAPRTRTARWLARRFEISTRTVERDIGALQQSGVPIYAQTGRGGGYTLDRSRTLPPVNVTSGEALAVAVALHGLAGTPFYDAGRSALAKLVAVMAPGDVARAEDLAARVSLVRPPAPQPPPRSPVGIHDAVTGRRVLAIVYGDRAGAVSERIVEPVGYVGGSVHWYLIAWCRLRAGFRAFRLDRIRAARQTGETAPPRGLDPTDDLDLPAGYVTRLTVGGG